MKNTLIITLSLICVACGVTKPDLAALYRIDERQTIEAMGETQAPVVVIPGIVSSKLVDETGKEVWFGSWYRVMFDTYDELALDIDPISLTPLPSKIKAGDLPHSVLGIDFYGSLFEILEDYGRYELTKPGTPYNGKGRRYYKFSYDWRYDNMDTVKKLDAYIEQIRQDYGDPNLEVDVIAHSMGGLVARYYMRYGTVDVLDGNEFPITQAGAKKVRRLIQLGTPNLGAVSALHQLMNGYKVLFGTMPVEKLITMPSAYQLLPHPLNDWLVTNDGKSLDRDLFDANIWRRFQWGIFSPKAEKRVIKNANSPEQGREELRVLQRYFEKHLERARRFVWSLSVPVPDLEYGIVAFGGNCSPTPARLLVEEVDGVSEVRLYPKEVKNKVKGVNYKTLMLEPGDGRVTKPSMLARDFLDPTKQRHKYSFFPLQYAFFLCHNHSALSGNVNFQDNLLNALLENDYSDFTNNKIE